MNWLQGLRRVSAAWWGLCAVLVAMSGVAAMSESIKLGATLIFVGLTICAVMHKATCWVINGFFEEK